MGDHAPSMLITPADARRLRNFEKLHHAAVVFDPVQTIVWDNENRSYHFRPISPAKNPRLNIPNGNLPKHRSEPVGTGEFLQLAGHLCPSSHYPGGELNDAPDWTPPPYNGFESDMMSANGADD